MYIHIYTHTQILALTTFAPEILIQQLRVGVPQVYFEIPSRLQEQVGGSRVLTQAIYCAGGKTDTERTQKHVALEPGLASRFSEEISLAGGLPSPRSQTCTPHMSTPRSLRPPASFLLTGLRTCSPQSRLHLLFPRDLSLSICASSLVRVWLLFPN